MREKEEYLAIVDQEEGELLAVSLIEEILTRGQEVLFEKHIESQVLPYAVQFARDTILTIVQWEFFKRDPGDVDSQTWLPDEEPQPAVIDSWARGAVPIRSQPPPIPPSPKKTIEATTPITASQVSLLSVSAGGVGRPSINQLNAKVSAVSLGSVKDKKRSDYSINSSSSAKLGSRIVQRPGSSRRAGGNGGMPSETEAQLTAAALAEQAIMEENKRTLTRIQNIEKDGGKVDVGYDNDGKVILVRKAVPSKLLTQGVRVKVINEGNVQAPKPTAANELTSSRLQLLAKSTGGHLHNIDYAVVRGRGAGDLSTKKAISRTTINAGSTSSINSIMSGGGFVPDTVLDIPLLADTMRLAPGVTLREGDIVKRGATVSRKERPTQPTSYLTQSRTETVPAVDPILSQVLSKAKPTLRPIPFPVIAVGGGDQRGISDNYARLPDIKQDQPPMEPIRHAAQAQ
ncbi:hypothetical protein HDU67_000124 [Dinochytrium kinnereticum]|nr:hypothetical protein HDU67_000124 [Dinochytrium kinnereticum]